MCNPTLLAPFLGAGATAAGATAAASTIGLGTFLSAGGALVQGVSGMIAGNRQAKQIERQMQVEAGLTATEDMRRRREFTSAIRTQAAELAARGVQLDSVTALALGQTAAREMSFDSQAIRQGGAARQTELSAEARIARSLGFTSMLKGTFSAADSILNAVPDLWPDLLEGST